jgi:hypothetical protein
VLGRRGGLGGYLRRPESERGCDVTVPDDLEELVRRTTAAVDREHDRELDRAVAGGRHEGSPREWTLREALVALKRLKSVLGA